MAQSQNMYRLDVEWFWKLLEVHHMTPQDFIEKTIVRDIFNATKKDSKYQFNEVVAEAFVKQFNDVCNAPDVDLKGGKVMPLVEPPDR